jgi:gamma-glutamylcyclotransferase (GGCT)/AIG2-like uncharacterized protein YtfP
VLLPSIPPTNETGRYAMERIEWISSLTNVVTLPVTVLGFALAYYVYWKEHGRHSAGMLLDAYKNFYDSSDHRRIRAALEIGAADSADRTALQKAVGKSINGEACASDEEEELLHQLDEYLNFFQFIGWLLDHKDLKASDVKGMFSYYVKDLCDEQNSWLLPYIHHYGFRGLERLLRSASEWSSDVTLLFVYGSLRKRVAQETEQALLKGSRRIGKASFWGNLYDVGSYPGLIESWDAGAVVHGELYEVSPSQLRELDKHEACGVEDGQEYVRRVCQVKGPNRKWVNAYVYIYNKDTSGLRLIEGGDYVAYRRSPR